MKYPIRINKYLREKGLASRREADKLIEDGSVFINGEKAENGMLVNESDKVEARSKQKAPIFGKLFVLNYFISLAFV